MYKAVLLTGSSCTSCLVCVDSLHPSTFKQSRADEYARMPGTVILISQVMDVTSVSRACAHDALYKRAEWQVLQHVCPRLQSCISTTPACRTSPHALKVQQLLTNGECVPGLCLACSHALPPSQYTLGGSPHYTTEGACYHSLLCPSRALFHCNPQGLCYSQSLACIKACRVLERGWCERC